MQIHQNDYSIADYWHMLEATRTITFILKMIAYTVDPTATNIPILIHLDSKLFSLLRNSVPLPM